MKIMRTTIYLLPVMALLALGVSRVLPINDHADMSGQAPQRSHVIAAGVDTWWLSTSPDNGGF